MRRAHVWGLVLVSVPLGAPVHAQPSAAAALPPRGTAARISAAPSRDDFKGDIGLHWFKLSASKPVELAPNAVFDRWESINASGSHTVHDYQALQPLYFNMVFGIDALVRFRRHLMLKVGYDLTHPFGIGGEGHIAYRDHETGTEVKEEKRFSFTSHQVTTFVGPFVSMDDNRVDLYLGFSPMAPTWVFYQEHYRRTEDGQVTQKVDRDYQGFFGSCRALIGMQVRVARRVKAGSEAVFTFLDHLPLSSGRRTDRTFSFPFMQWDFTARYALW